eukprot:Pgem_evm1s1790
MLMREVVSEEEVYNADTNDSEDSDYEAEKKLVMSVSISEVNNLIRKSSSSRLDRLVDVEQDDVNTQSPQTLGAPRSNENLFTLIKKSSLGSLPRLEEELEEINTDRTQGLSPIPETFSFSVEDITHSENTHSNTARSDTTRSESSVMSESEEENDLFDLEQQSPRESVFLESCNILNLGQTEQVKEIQVKSIDINNNQVHNVITSKQCVVLHTAETETEVGEARIFELSVQTSERIADSQQCNIVDNIVDETSVTNVDLFLNVAETILMSQQCTTVELEIPNELTVKEIDLDVLKCEHISESFHGHVGEIIVNPKRASTLNLSTQQAEIIALSDTVIVHQIPERKITNVNSFKINTEQVQKCILLQQPNVLEVVRESQVKVSNINIHVMTNSPIKRCLSLGSMTSSEIEAELCVIDEELKDINVSINEDWGTSKVEQFLKPFILYNAC